MRLVRLVLKKDRIGKARDIVLKIRREADESAVEEVEKKIGWQGWC